jgi:outer membrane receptor protein involved in Fe transport
MDTRVFYYGYDYLGLEEVDDQDVDAFAAGENYNIEPYQPIYYAGYIQDKIEFRDIVLQLGARLDVFDNNALVLRDPYSLFEITRAGDLTSSVPSNVKSDYSVFFDESTGAVRGYRDLEGQFYDPDGNSVISRDVTFGAAVQIKTDENGAEMKRLTSNVFKEYEPQVNFQPRIGVSFPVTDQALFYASYDVVTQRPSENVYDTIHQYKQATEFSKRNNNPDLKPERTTQYELGFRQRLGARAAIQLSGFYRQIENKIALRIFQNVSPANYQSYQNVDFGTVKGVELEFDLRRTQGLALTANYTLSFAKGTGADAAATGQIVWRQETLPFYPNFLSFLDFDQRHTANVTMDYRLGQGEGPSIGGSRPLQNFGVNLVATVGSGLPYTRRTDTSPLYTAFNGFLEGELNSSRLPSTTMLNLRVDRRFPLTGRTNLVVYLWVQNLLNTKNVLSVYPQTGLAGDDGYLSGPEGRDQVAAIANSQGAALAESFADHYGIAADNPFRYGIPRQTRIGLRLDF